MEVSSLIPVQAIIIDAEMNFSFCIKTINNFLGHRKNLVILLVTIVLLSFCFVFTLFRTTFYDLVRNKEFMRHLKIFKSFSKRSKAVWSTGGTIRTIIIAVRTSKPKMKLFPGQYTY